MLWHMSAQLTIVHTIVVGKLPNVVRVMPILEGLSSIVVLVVDSIVLAS